MRDVNASRRSGNYPTDVTACRVERARKKKHFRASVSPSWSGDEFTARTPGRQRGRCRGVNVEASL